MSEEFMLRKADITINTANISEEYFFTLEDEGRISVKSGEIIECNYLALLYDEIYRIRLSIYDNKEKKKLMGVANITISENGIEITCHGILEANYTLGKEDGCWNKDAEKEILPIAKGVSLTVALSNSRDNCVVKIVII